MFQYSKNYGSPICVTSLKVALNIADPIICLNIFSVCLVFIALKKDKCIPGVHNPTLWIKSKNLIPIFFLLVGLFVCLSACLFVCFLSWDFYAIRSVYLWSDCLLNLTCNFLLNYTSFCRSLNTYKHELEIM